MRRTEQRIPEQASKAVEMKGMQNAVAMMIDVAQRKGGSGCGDQNEECEHDGRNHQCKRPFVGLQFWRYPARRYESSLHCDQIICVV